MELLQDLIACSTMLVEKPLVLWSRGFSLTTLRLNARASLSVLCTTVFSNCRQKAVAILRLLIRVREEEGEEKVMGWLEEIFGFFPGSVAMVRHSRAESWRWEKLSSSVLHRLRLSAVMVSAS